MTKLQGSMSQNTYQNLQREDKRRLFEAARKVSMKARLTRRRKRAEKKSKGETKTSYLAGSFGLKETPVAFKSKKGKPTKSKTTVATHLSTGAANMSSTVNITFVDDSMTTMITDTRIVK